MNSSLKNILIIGPAWVGDMVMSQVICAGLRARYSDACIDVLAPAVTVKLVQRMPEVSRGILLKQQHGQLGLGYRMGLGKQLAANKYDWAIVTPNSLKSALVPFFADIPRRTGFLGEYRYFLLNDIKLLDKKRLPRMTDRFLALIDQSGNQIIKPRLMVDEQNQARFLSREFPENPLESFLDKRGVPIIGLCPGAEFGDAKKWPEQHYVELGRQLVKQGKRVWIFGSPAEVATGKAIAEAIGEGAVNLAGRTSLLDAIDLLALCERVVTNDSGLMHLAAAIGTPVIALYGSTSPDFTPPLADDARILRLGLDCSPCFKRDCPLGHKDCLNQLHPDQVLAEMP